MTEVSAKSSNEKMNDFCFVVVKFLNKVLKIVRIIPCFHQISKNLIENVPNAYAQDLQHKTQKQMKKSIQLPQQQRCIKTQSPSEGTWYIAVMLLNYVDFMYIYVTY